MNIDIEAERKLFEAAQNPKTNLDLRGWFDDDRDRNYYDTVTDIAFNYGWLLAKRKLAAPQQEPVAEVMEYAEFRYAQLRDPSEVSVGTLLYAGPPAARIVRRPPPGAPVLSDEEILKWYRATPQFSTAWTEGEEEVIAIGRALLAKVTKS